MLLLREGWLRPNNVSKEIRSDFALRSRLEPVPVKVKGAVSNRNWFIVADLTASAKGIVEQTAEFTLACIRARSNAGGGKKGPAQVEPYSLGVDEKGRIVVVNRRGGTAKVRALQGFVYEALKKRLGGTLTKPTANGYAVDGMIETANVLLEIKTGTFAHHCYEAVGQLRLYPALIGMDRKLEPILLLPDTPAVKPAMAGALREAGVDVYTYTVGGVGRKPRIEFSPEFLNRCRRRVSA